MKTAWIVVDLGFGDAGKGATVDFLVRDQEADLVVRHHGGAQAGHNVVTPEGRHHTFSQFGAGTFVEGVRTLLGPGFVLHPGALLVEANALTRVGVADALERNAVDARALVISPFQQAAGRLRELARGAAAHGTCGVGVGEAVSDSIAGMPDVLRADDLGSPDALVRKLESQRRRKSEEFSRTRFPSDDRVERELALLTDRSSVDRTVAQWRPVANGLRVISPCETTETIRKARSIIFEGAQGVLLDQDRGFHPHTTWSDCTPAGALALLNGIDARVIRLGVIRTYMVRHGPGPLPTFESEYDRRFPEAHNQDFGWQGLFRRGPLDLPLLRYSIDACGGVDGLALTCLDLTGSMIDVCRGYESPEPLVRLDVPPSGDHAALSRLGEMLRNVKPRIERVPRETIFSVLEAELGVPVLMASEGPTARDRRWLSDTRERIRGL
jgi:adenylosuccinate synthase